MNMTKQRLILAILAIGCIALVFYFVPTPYERYYSRLTQDKLIGLTTNEVVQSVGNPASIVEQEEIWIYRMGKDPGICLLFMHGRVSEVVDWRK